MMTPEGTVYVLDDEQEMLKAISRLLRAHDFNVVTFESSNNFFAYVRDDGPACLILDLSMPESSGLDVQKTMQEQGISLPIIFLTGHGDIPTSVQAMKSGAEDFLTKPIDGDVLLPAVRAALARARANIEETRELAELRVRFEQLTPRQREVLEYVIAGKLNKTIAHELGTGEQNIKVHRRRVIRKMGVKSVAELARLAERLGVQPAK